MFNTYFDLQSELFQDDLFPPTRITWSATLSAEDWFACNDKIAAKVSLKPEGMDTRKILPSLASSLPLSFVQLSHSRF